MRFLVLGATGMAGHTVSIYLKERGHTILAFSRKPSPFFEGILGDVTDFDKLKETIQEGRFDAVINCVGILNQEAEKNKPLAVLINSYLPHFLSSVTQEMDTFLIHLSTDCVFSGQKGKYKEDSFPDGSTFYARSKALGEIVNNKDMTFRTSIVGPDMKIQGIGLFNWFMKQEGSIKGFTKAIWTGVTTLTLAKAMEKAARTHLTGLYNLVNNQTISKFELLQLFNRHFRNSKVAIHPEGSVNIDKSLVNTRNDFPFEVPSYETMILEMKEWVYSHKKLYPHYFDETRSLGR